MSMVRCESCDAYIDSDHDPECFQSFPLEHIFCETCRDQVCPMCNQDSYGFVEALRVCTECGYTE